MKYRLWGGNKLNTLFNKPNKGANMGESWEISAVEGDVSVVANGQFKDHTLQQLINTHKANLLGQSVMQRFGTNFPILIKFIDAKLDLSIQVHPNDTLAKKTHNSFGKTEMWYVMDADPGAQLIMGFNQDLDQEVYKNHLKNNTLLEVLNYEKVTTGDTFLINTGTIHAIGAGVLLAEIQQTSDATYRVYDFNRKDKDGNLRALHTNWAIEAMNFKKQNDFKVAYLKNENTPCPMVHSPYFKTDYVRFTQNITQDISTTDSFIILVCVAGSATISNEFGAATIQTGESSLIAASCKIGRAHV